MVFLHEEIIITQNIQVKKFLCVVTQKMSLIDFLIYFYKDFKMHKKHHMIEEANLFLIVLNYYINIFKEQILEERIIIRTPDWIASKKATISPKNEKDNKCFQWSITSGLNYNQIKEKGLKKMLKFERVDTDFSSFQREQEESEQNHTSIALNILFVSHNSEEIKLAYKSNYNKRNNQVILLMINNENNNSIILL